MPSVEAQACTVIYAGDSDHDLSLYQITSLHNSLHVLMSAYPKVISKYLISDHCFASLFPFIIVRVANGSIREREVYIHRAYTEYRSLCQDQGFVQTSTESPNKRLMQRRTYFSTSRLVLKATIPMKILKVFVTRNLYKVCTVHHVTTTTLLTYLWQSRDKRTVYIILPTRRVRFT